jgi:hypothetical protein
MENLPVQIPLDYAEELGVDASFLTHVNRGRRNLSPANAIKLLGLAANDKRLRGLTIQMLRPEAIAYETYFREFFKKELRRLKKSKCQVPRCPVINHI